MFINSVKFTRHISISTDKRDCQRRGVSTKISFCYKARRTVGTGTFPEMVDDIG